MTAPGLVIAAPASGSGKTTLTLGLLRHLARAGRRVASAKAGPDYIDPAFHAAATGRACLNLDCWAMRPETVAALVQELSRDAELVVCEGVMGLFDGAGAKALGSTADLASLLGWPVVLVLDVARQGQSAAALARGMVAHRADIAVVGAVLNRVAGDRHARLVGDALRATVPGVRLLGALPRDPALALPERHLGLVQAREHAALGDFLDRAADAVGRHLDVDALVALARPANVAAGADGAMLPPLGQRIAVARDDAFAFAYAAVLDGWRAAGAEIAFFSPLADEAPARAADAVYLPGGYPELHAARLAAAARFKAGMAEAAARGAAIYGECGGYMVLGRALVDAQGAAHAMLDLLPHAASFARPRLHLGYRRATLAVDTPLGRAGDRFRAHEFHYAEAGSDAAPPLFHVADSDGAQRTGAGAVGGRVFGSFIHLIDRE